MLEDFEKNNSNWEIESGEKFARKNRLGKYGEKKNKEKDLAKMARAGFNCRTHYLLYLSYKNQSTE